MGDLVYFHSTEHGTMPLKLTLGDFICLLIYSVANLHTYLETRTWITFEVRLQLVRAILV